MRKILSSCLLVILAFVLTPTQVWHECAGHHNVEHEHHDAGHDHHEGESKESKDCQICDFEFASFLATETGNTPALVTRHSEYAVGNASSAKQCYRLALHSRGPPVV